MKKIVSLFLVLSIAYPGTSQVLKRPIPDHMVVLTFDDAVASQYSIVAPLLKQYGFHATFFVCEFPPNFSDSSKYMNWRQIRELDKMGFEIASHTRTHANVGKLTKEQFIDQLNYIENKCDSLKIDKPVNFAYPGYGLSLPAINTLQEKGYHFARAGGSRAYDPLHDHPLLIPSWATNANNKKEILEALQKAKDGKIVVLTIHGVPDIEHPWVNTPPELFKEYLQYLSVHHYKVISIRDLSTYIDYRKAMKTIVPDLSKPLKN